MRNASMGDVDWLAQRKVQIVEGLQVQTDCCKIIKLALQIIMLVCASLCVKS